MDSDDEEKKAILAEENLLQLEEARKVMIFLRSILVMDLK